MYHRRYPTTSVWIYKITHISLLPGLLWKELNCLVEFYPVPLSPCTTDHIHDRPWSTIFYRADLIKFSYQCRTHLYHRTKLIIFMYTFIILMLCCYIRRFTFGLHALWDLVALKRRGFAIAVMFVGHVHGCCIEVNNSCKALFFCLLIPNLVSCPLWDSVALIRASFARWQWRRTCHGYCSEV